MATRGTWKIVIGSTTLADYSDVVKRDSIDGGPMIQTEPLAFSDAQFQAARGNYMITRNMTVTKTFVDSGGSVANKLAVDWFETAAQVFNGVYDVLLTHMDMAGVETSYQVLAANVKVVADEPIGITVILKVSISGGKSILHV